MGRGGLFSTGVGEMNYYLRVWGERNCSLMVCGNDELFSTVVGERGTVLYGCGGEELFFKGVGREELFSTGVGERNYSLRVWGERNCYLMVWGEKNCSLRGGERGTEDIFRLHRLHMYHCMVHVIMQYQIWLVGRPPWEAGGRLPTL